MSSETGSDTSPCDFDGSTVHTARCKWFNNKAGYGFLTVVRSSDESKVGSDVFAHHTGITVGSEQYKYLVQGEYVDFKMRETDSGDHAIQAADITGVGGGQLMCETRNEQRKQQEPFSGFILSETTKVYLAVLSYYSRFRSNTLSRAVHSNQTQKKGKANFNAKH